MKFSLLAARASVAALTLTILGPDVVRGRSIGSGLRSSSKLQFQGSGSQVRGATLRHDGDIDLDMGEVAALREDTDDDVTSRRVTSAPLMPSNPAQTKSLKSTLHTVLAATGDLVALVKSESSGNQELDNLELSVLKLAKSGASPGVAGFVEEIRTILDTKMRVEVWRIRNATEANLDTLYQGLMNCSVVKTNLTELIPDTFLLPSLNASHRSCRKDQHLAHDMSIGTRGLADSIFKLKEVYCDAYSSNDSLSNHPGANQCNPCLCCTGRVFQDDNAAYNYFEYQEVFWTDLYSMAQFSRERCGNYTTLWEDADVNATRAEAAEAVLKDKCTALQSQMDTASCDYEATWNRKCSPTQDGSYPKCYDEQLELYSVAWGQAYPTQQTSLQDQMRAILRINCYLGVFNLSNIDAGITVCRDTDYLDDSHVKSLAFTKHQIPAPASCGARPMQHWAGYVEYEAMYYADTHALSDTCGASCCKNTKATPTYDCAQFYGNGSECPMQASCAYTTDNGGKCYCKGDDSYQIPSTSCPQAS